MSNESWHWISVKLSGKTFSFYGNIGEEEAKADELIKAQTLELFKKLNIKLKFDESFSWSILGGNDDGYDHFYYGD